jgi:hypothetical protein
MLKSKILDKMVVLNSHECRACKFGWQGLETLKQVPSIEIRGLGINLYKRTGLRWIDNDFRKAIRRETDKHYKQYHPAIYNYFKKKS